MNEEEMRAALQDGRGVAFYYKGHVVRVLDFTGSHPNLRVLIEDHHGRVYWCSSSGPVTWAV